MSRSFNKTKKLSKKKQRDLERARSAKKKKIRNIVISVCVAVALVGFTILIWPEPAADNTDTSAQAWVLPNLEDSNELIALSDFAGKPLVVPFFASWCEVCKEEIPGYLEVSAALGDDVAFVGINAQDNGNGLDMAKNLGMVGVWPLVEDVGGVAGSGLSVGTFEARGMPMTVFYTAKGVVAHVQYGGMTPEQLVSKLVELGLYDSN